MTVLDRLKNALQQPEQPTGDPAEFERLREAAYKELFHGDPVRVLTHEKFGKPKMGGNVDIRICTVTFTRDVGDVEVAVTSGLSDYAMKLPNNGGVVRRELIQYFREPRPEDIVRLHNLAWLPLAARYCLDYFHTVGPAPVVELPGAVFLPSLIKPHANFALKLGDDDVKLLWHVPLTQRELDYKIENGTDALLKKMQECQLPWVFDPNTRVPIV